MDDEHDLTAVLEDLQTSDGKPDGDAEDELNPESTPVQLEEDPLYIPLDDLIPGSLEDTPEAFEELCSLPKAFSEDPAIRHGYVAAFAAAAFDGATHLGVQRILQSHRTNLQAVQARHPNHIIEGLDNMAQTLSTVERRLGVSTDNFVTYYMLCDKCWSVHHPSTLIKLASSKCPATGCSGLIYQEKPMGAGRSKRVPMKILSYVHPKLALQHLLLRPGKWDQLQAWRGPNDKIGRMPPTTTTGLAAFLDPDQPMRDVHDGWKWRHAQAGLERRQGGPWNVQDVDVKEVNQRFAALPCGLQIQMNVDWYVYVAYIELIDHTEHILYRFQAVKHHSHSTGALYFVVLNNPRSVRYRREETVLAMIMPGPHEPNQEQMNNIMDLWVDHLLELSKGGCALYELFCLFKLTIQ
jgi:hypothetical protein